MKIGDIEGKGKIYDDKGKPILKKNEQIIEIFIGTCLNWATRKKGKLHGIMNFEGEGEFTVTDKRVLFLRKPRDFPPGYWAVGRQSGGLVGDELVGGGDWQYVLARSNRAKKMGGLEYLEIRLEELKRINIASENAQIYIENKDKFRLITDKDTGEKLAEILGKN
jgi:hypothetical protein